ncbi:MAG: Ig-like domain-containing protein, partial [Anaerolineae bacterium]|nr:Ig-like domain-containing protein [Anaerolineae bacterium]
MRYKTVTLVVIALLLIGAGATACLGRGRAPTPTPTVPPATSPTATPTPGPTPTPLPPDQRVPEGMVSPVVVQHSPLPGEELALDGAIEVVFDRAMDKDSVEKAFEVSPALAGRFQWADARTVRYLPADLARGTSYHVYLGQGARDTAGAILSGAYRFRFDAVGYLEVSQVIPAHDSADVEADSVVTVMFNRPVVPLTTLAGQASLPDPLTFDPPLAGRGEWLNTSIYVFHPDQPLAGGTRYVARVAAGLTDTIGGVLDEDYVWSFSTIPPQVVWTAPSADNPRPVGPDTEVRVTFNQPVDAASAVAAFSMEREGLAGRQVEGTFEVLTETLVYRPAQMLDFDATYRVRIEAGVQSASGGEGMRAPFEWQIVTAPLPQIVGTMPEDGEQSADPHTGFRIEFNTVIDPATVMPNLTWTPPLSPTQVYTYYSEWDYAFYLHFGAEPSTDYQVEIGPEIADPYGNTTGQRMTVRFRTAPLDPEVWLQVPGSTSTANANDPARVTVRYVNVERLDLALYRLSLQEFLDAQRNWYDYQPRERIRAWQERVEAPLNESAVARVDLVEGGGRLTPGIYLLDLTSPDLKGERRPERHFLIVSTLNLTVKSSATEILVWATDLDSGDPVPDLALRAHLWRDGTLLGGVVHTDRNGLARFPRGTEAFESVFVVGEPAFVLGATDWGYGISPWDFGLSGGEGYQPYRVHVYTDRPIYRAGQTVYYRGIVRAEEDAQYDMPAISSVQVSIRDAAGELVLDRRLSLDAFGAFSGELVLDEGAALGDYSISVEVGERWFADRFQVAAYRAPEFEVTVAPERAEVVRGEASRATVAVRYFYGGPVRDAPVQWNVIGEIYTFAPPAFDRYSFSDTDDPWVCRTCWWQPAPPPLVLLSGAGNTDGEGNLVIDLPGEWVDEEGEPIEQSLVLTVEATVSGADGQVISGRSEAIVHRSATYVGLAPQQYVGRAEREMAIDLLTVDWAAERQPNRALQLSVYRREWVNLWIENEVGGGRWEWTTEDTLITEGRVTTGAQGEGRYAFTPPEGGAYHVIAETVDEAPAARSSIFVWASGREYVSWRRTNEDRIDLIPDRGTYVPGDTAEILIPSPFSGAHWAWITVERGGVLRQEVILLESNSTVYRLPIEDRYAPNIYVSAVIVKGKDVDNPTASYKLGYAALTVTPEPQTLHVELTPSVTQAEPGDTVTFDVRATDYTGEPVAAGFSLDLVDKAVLSLLPREPDAIRAAFYGRRALQIQTATGLAISLNRLLTGQEEEAVGLRTYGLARDEAAMEAAPPAPTAPQAAVEKAVGGGAAAPEGVTLRETFADTAYWRADVSTDQAGLGRVEITLPDNLTTWVFRGVGTTTETVVGEATVELLVTKPLLVRPVTPRFFVVGDEAYLSALVSNNTDADREVDVSLSSVGLTLYDPEVQTVSVPARGEVKVTWRVRAEDVSAVEVIMGAVSGAYSDAARPRLTAGADSTLLVYRYTAPDIVGTGGQIVNAGGRTEVVALPPRYDDQRGELAIQVDPSLAAGMREGLDYLEHFEYECTEQTVSRFLPNVLTYRALRALGIDDPELEDKLPDLVQEGLDKLYLQQRDDGGWGWWRESWESSPYITAYVVFAMAKARDAGFEVDAGALERGLSYLNGQLVQARGLKSHWEANRQAFIL